MAIEIVLSVFELGFWWFTESLKSFSLYILELKRKGRILTEELDKEEKTATIITKMAKTDYPISELISRRWSARAFSTKPVEKSKLLSLLEAARWAPSSRNEQPWRYIVFTNDNPEKLKKAHSVLKEINDYAKRAPILIMTRIRSLQHIKRGFIKRSFVNVVECS
jgi:hypothetical protein